MATIEDKRAHCDSFFYAYIEEYMGELPTIRDLVGSLRYVFKETNLEHERILISYCIGMCYLSTFDTVNHSGQSIN